MIIARSMFSTGRFFEGTERSGEAVGDIWNDYQLSLPSADKFSKTYMLSDSVSYTRCTKCRAKKLVSCNYCSDGRIKYDWFYFSDITLLYILYL